MFPPSTGCCRSAAGLHGSWLAGCGPFCCLIGSRWALGCWPGMIRSQNAQAPTSSARGAIAMVCARPTATQRSGGGTRGSCGRCWSRAPVPSGPGRSRWWWPWIATPSGIRPLGHAIQRRRLSPGCCWRAWCAGFPSAASSLWGIPARAPARPHGFATDTGVPSRWFARCLVTPPYTNRRPRARLAPWDGRG